MRISRSVTPEDGVVSRTLTKITPVKEKKLDLKKVNHSVKASEPLEIDKKKLVQSSSQLLHENAMINSFPKQLTFEDNNIFAKMK